MSAGEIAFLALGALLGGIVAGVVIAYVRARSAARPNVRLTIAPRTVPAMTATTLSATVGPWSAPAKGGPADPSTLLSAMPAHEPTVDPGGRVAVAADAPPSASADDAFGHLAGAADGAPPARRIETHVLNGERVGVPVEPEEELDFSTLVERRAVTTANGGSLSPMATAASEVLAATARHEQSAAGTSEAANSSVAMEVGVETSGDRGREAVEAPGPLPTGDPARDAVLGERRQAVRERCAVADRLKAAAVVAAETLRSERRAYDVCLEQIRKAEAAVDGRTIRAAKDAAQLEFRRARVAARSHADVEEAARRWLGTIDSINHDARTASVRLSRDRQAAARAVVRLERLGVETDAARIAAEAAEETCLAARQRLASAEQGAADDAEAEHAESGQLIPLDPGAPQPTIVRLLRGDHAALLDVVARLAGTDADEQRRWQLQLAAFVDGIVARALEMAWLEFPIDHTFWAMFSLQQDRDIANSLASLGYRFDGLAGFADGRIPGQRELSLAVGYAGLDPMRIRRWPDQETMGSLYRDVRVEAAEFVAAEAPALSLGQLVALLGQRAEPLTDVWNNWGRIRPLLLSA